MKIKKKQTLGTKTGDVLADILERFLYPKKSKKSHTKKKLVGVGLGSVAIVAAAKAWGKERGPK